MSPTETSRRREYRFSKLSRALVSQSNDIWDFHTSWCRFVTVDKDNHSDKRHKHSLYEIQLVQSGSLSIFLADGSAQTILQNQFILIPPQTSHYLHFNTASTCKLVLAFTAKTNRAILREALQKTAELRVYDATPEMLSLVDALRQKADDSLFLAPYAIIFLVQGLVLEALDIMMPFAKSPAQDMQKKSINDLRIDKASQYVLNNITRAVTSQEIADNLGINIRHLNRLCNASYGHSIHRLIQNLRIEHAQMLLESTSMSLADIAESMNYSSVYAFIRAFKNICGVTPGKFQKDASVR